MAYNPALVHATSQGIPIWSVVTFILVGLYGDFKIREGEYAEGAIAVASAIFMLLVNWATDYYRAVWVGIIFLIISIITYFTALRDTFFRPLFMWTGGCLIISSMLNYFAQPIVFEGMMGFAIGCFLIGLILAIDIHLDRFTHYYEILLSFGAALIGALIAVSIFGVSHIWYGLAMMYAGLIATFLGVRTKFTDPLFMAGFIVYIDDVVGYLTISPKLKLMPIAFGLGFFATVIYMLRRWLDEV